MLVEQTKKQQKQYDRAKKKEEKKRDATLFWAKLFKKKINPQDTRTLQIHKNVTNGISCYIASAYLNEGANISDIQTMMEDVENQRYVYKGMMAGADNACGIIESNIPLSEILASPEGNTTLLEMISKENAVEVRNQYYQKIGEPVEPLENHMLYWGKPDFVLGTITRDPKGKFSYYSDIMPDIEEILQKEREEIARKEKMRDKESVEMDLGGGIVIARQDCWLEQGKEIAFAGINSEALYWKYSAVKPMPIEEGKYYIQIGKLQIGKSTTSNPKHNEPLQLITPYVYDNVVLFTEGKKLIQYFIANKYDGLNFALGEIFHTGNLKRLQENQEELESDSKPILVGGITMDENSCVKKATDIPKSIREWLNDNQEEIKKESAKIVKFRQEDRE